MSRPSSSTLTRPLGFAAVFVATAFAGWKLADREANRAGDRENLTALSDRIPTRASQPRRAYGPTSQAKQQVRSVLEAGTTEERMRATISLVNSLSVEELERWLEERWYENRNGFDLTLFNKLAKERWRQEDPEGFLAWGIRENEQSSSLVFDRWAKDDPQRLIGFFENSPDTRKELEALGMIAKHDPSVALARFQTMIANGEITPDQQYLGRQFFQELASASPEALEAAMSSMPDNVRDQAEAALLTERLKTDFSGELRKLWERPDGWKLFEDSMQNGRPEDIGDKLLSELGNFPDSWKAGLSGNYYRFISNENAASWLALDFTGNGFTEQQATRMQSYAIQNLSSSDPAAALRGLAGIEMDKDTKNNVLQNIFFLHANDEAKTAELIAMLDTDAERQIAEKAGKRRRDQSSSSNTTAKIETPDQWLEQVADFDPQSGSSYQLLSQLRNLNQEQLAEIGSQFKTMPDEQKRTVAEVLSGRQGSNNLDPALQADAIGYLVSNPTEKEDGPPQNAREFNRMTSRHAVKWGMKDPIAASEWTSTLPAGEPRLWAQKNLAANWNQYDPDAAKQWVNSLRPDDRKAVNEFMKEGASK